MDAAAAGRTGAGAGRGKAAPYIRISAEEIADDYPLPKLYEKGECVRSEPGLSMPPCL